MPFVRAAVYIGGRAKGGPRYGDVADLDGNGAPQMKATGIVRKVDELGRIVLPIELRRTLDIAERDPLEIYVDGPSIILKRRPRRRRSSG